MKKLFVSISLFFFFCTSSPSLLASDTLTLAEDVSTGVEMSCSFLPQLLIGLQVLRHGHDGASRTAALVDMLLINGLQVFWDIRDYQTQGRRNTENWGDSSFAEKNTFWIGNGQQIGSMLGDVFVLGCICYKMGFPRMIPFHSLFFGKSDVSEASLFVQEKKISLMCDGVSCIYPLGEKAKVKTYGPGWMGYYWWGRPSPRDPEEMPLCESVRHEESCEVTGVELYPYKVVLQLELLVAGLRTPLKREITTKNEVKYFKEDLKSIN